MFLIVYNKKDCIYKPQHKYCASLILHTHSIYDMNDDYADAHPKEFRKKMRVYKKYNTEWTESIGKWIAAKNVIRDIKHKKPVNILRLEAAKAHLIKVKKEHDIFLKNTIYKEMGEWRKKEAITEAKKSNPILKFFGF